MSGKAARKNKTKDEAKAARTQPAAQNPSNAEGDAGPCARTRAIVSADRGDRLAGALPSLHSQQETTKEYTMGLMDILNQVLTSGTASDQHVDQVVQSVPSDALAAGLAHAFRSDQTPEIGAMVAQMFGASNGQQQAGMLNQIIAALGPAVASGLGAGALGSIIGPGNGQVTAAQASQLSPQQVQDIVQGAHQVNPSIADELASFYSQHSGLIKTLGGVALAVAMTKIKDHVS